MALSKLGQGTEEGMQLLAGWGGNDTGDSNDASGRGIVSLAVERIARIASNIITTGSAALSHTPGDIFTGEGGGGGEVR